MPPRKDFGSAIRQQQVRPPAGTGVGKLGVVGETANPIREEFERAAEEVPVQYIEIVHLLDNPFQKLARPVVDEEALEELANSIRQNEFYGALLARRKRGSRTDYELAFGHRRREASRRVGLTKLPVKILDLSDTQMARIMASENFSRENLSPIGEANVIGHLSTMQNMSIDDIAEVVGKKKGWIQPRLNLYNAPKDVKDLVEAKPEAFSHSRLLTQIKDAEQRGRLIYEIMVNNLTFQQLEAFANDLKNGNNPFDKNFTNDSIDADSEKANNLQEVRKKLAAENAVAYKLEVMRDDALRKLDKAAIRFERLAAETNYELTKQEKRRLREVLERLTPFLEATSFDRRI
jgi:ParB family transcriptional regulator, chromosome partitioning protein